MLRVGIVLDSYTCSAWVAKVLDDIQTSGFSRIEIIVVKEGKHPSSPTSGTKLPGQRSFSLFHLYECWDYARNKVEPDALAPIDVSASLRSLPSVFAPRSRRGCTDVIPEDVSTQLRTFNLDVILYFGVPALGGGILDAARFGVWSFDPGDGLQDPDSAPLFWQLYQQNPVTWSGLRILGNSPETDRVIYQSQAATDMYSLVRSRNSVYWKTSEFAMRRLRDLHLHGIDYINSDSAISAANYHYRTPNALQMCRFMFRYGIHWLDEKIASLRAGPRAKWCIAIRKRSGSHRFDDPAGFQLMRSAKDRFHADPFLFEKDGKTYLFFEDFRFPLGRAIISCCELDEDGMPGEHVEVLRRPYHLSYPFIFEDGGEIYMLPETRGNRTVELYRATNFPYEWVADSILLSDVDIVDSTIQKIDGRYWMFCGMSNGRFSNCDELGLFFADSLKGPWTLHPKAPLISDVLRARPAGELFYEGRRLIRPSQDCGKAYGYALVFSEILTLTQTEYEECFISRLEPGVVNGNLANHTYNRTDRFEVVDRNFPAKIANLPEN
jgi:hypothetical protein